MHDTQQFIYLSAALFVRYIAVFGSVTFDMWHCTCGISPDGTSPWPVKTSAAQQTVSIRPLTSPTANMQNRRVASHRHSTMLMAAGMGLPSVLLNCVVQGSLGHRVDGQLRSDFEPATQIRGARGAADCLGAET